MRVADLGVSDPWHRRSGVVFVLLGVLAVAAYSPALTNAFYNDDALFLNHARRVLDDFTALSSERPLGYFRPVWSLWVTALYALFGTTAAGYFAAGIALHAVTAFLLYRIAARLFDDGVAAFTAAAVFVTSYAHGEATLWIAAQNSSLVCCFAFGALLTHLRACESNSVRDALATAGFVVLMLLTKEPGIVATAWLPLAEWRMHGLRRCFTKPALARYALIAAAGIVYLAINPRLIQDAFAGQAEQGVKELRSTLGFVSLERIFGTAPWMWSAQRFTTESLAPWLGLAMFCVPFGIAVWVARRRVGDVLLSLAVFAIAAAPACSTRIVQFNGSRLYYFPTAGTALLAGALVVIARDRLRSTTTASRLDIATCCGLALFAGNHISRIHHRNAVDYAPISRAQTHLAQALRESLASGSARVVYLIEPWIDNEMHAKEFFSLFAGVDPAQVNRLALQRDEAMRWLDRQRTTTLAPVLDCDSEGNLVPATGIPPMRNSSQGASRDATRPSGELPIVRVLAVKK